MIQIYDRLHLMTMATHILASDTLGDKVHTWIWSCTTPAMTKDRTARNMPVPILCSCLQQTQTVPVDDWSNISNTDMRDKLHRTTVFTWTHLHLYLRTEWTFKKWNDEMMGNQLGQTRNIVLFWTKNGYRISHLARHLWCLAKLTKQILGSSKAKAQQNWINWCWFVHDNLSLLYIDCLHTLEKVRHRVMYTYSMQIFSIFN